MDELVLYDGAYSGHEIDEAVSRALPDGELDNAIDSLIAAVGTPLSAATVAAMTDHDRIYVYTGSETGYVAGNWYYWNGSAWTSGGVYNAAAVDSAMSPSSNNAVENRVIDAAIKAVMTGVASICPPAPNPVAYEKGDVFWTGNKLCVATQSISGRPVIGTNCEQTSVWSLISKLQNADKLFYSAFPTQADSGAVVSTQVGADGVPLKQLIVDVNAEQSGSGDPSPTNFRPIAGRTEVTIIRSPTQDAEDPAAWALTVLIPNTIGTIYGGTLKYNYDGTWTLVKTHSIAVSNASGQMVFENGDVASFSGNNSASLPAGGYAYINVSNNLADYRPAAWASGNGACSMLITASLGSVKAFTPYKTGGGVGRIAFTNPDITGWAEASGSEKAALFQQWVADQYALGNQLQAIWKLDVPQTFTFAFYSAGMPTTVSQLGPNYLWADSGDADVVWRCDPTLYIDEKLAALGS